MSGNLKTFYEFGPFRIDAEEGKLLRDGEVVKVLIKRKATPLPPKAVEVLLLLVRNSGSTLTYEKFMDELWPGLYVEKKNVTDNVSLVRKALGDKEGAERYIETRHGRGYCFVSEVREVQEEAACTVISEHTKIQLSIEEETEEVLDAASEPAIPLASLHRTPAPLTISRSGGQRRSRNGVALLALCLVVAGLGGALLTWKGIFKGSSQENEGRAAGLPPKMSFTRVTNSGKVGTSTISPDGKLIAYTQNYTPYSHANKGTGSLYVQQQGSNHEVQLLEPGERLFGNTEFSRDGEYIYYQVFDRRDPRGALYRINALGGPPLRLFGDMISMFSLSPDGSRVTFYRHDPARRELRLLITALDGSDEQTLFVRPYSDVAFTGIPAWSPDGRLIAFVPDISVSKLDKDEPETIYGIDIASREMKPLTKEHWSSIGKMVWTADGHGLIFVASRPDVGNQLYYLSYPEGVVRRITNDLHSYGNYGLGVTADGSTLVAEIWETQSQLWMVGADGDSSRALQLTRGTADGRRGVIWLADGRIAYVAREGGEYDLWTIKEDGSDAKPITADSFIDTEVAATPDGRFLVFTSNRAGGSHIFRMESDGSHAQQLTFGDTRDALPDSSPDGQWVVYASTLDEKTTVWKVSIDGGSPIRLTDYECQAPSFSPDGKLISCIIPAETQFQQGSIAIIPAEGGAPVKTFNVMPFFWSYLSARWTPDGQALVFRDSTSYVSNLWKQSLAGGSPRQFTNFKTDTIFNYTYSRDGQHLILSRGRTTINVVLIKDFV